MNIRKYATAYGGLIIAMICWSMTFIWYKQAYPHLTPLTLVTLRLFVAAVLLFIVAIAFRLLNPVQLNDIPRFLLLSFFEPFIYFLGESYGMKYVSSTLASLIIATIPLFTPFFAWYVLREKLKPGNYFGIFISMAGVFLLIQTDKNDYSSLPLGIVLMMVAVFSAIGFTITAKKLTEKYNSFTIVVYQNVLGFLFFLPVFLLFENSGSLFASFNVNLLMPVIKLAVFGSLLAFILFVNTIKLIGVSRANVFINLIPVLTAIFSYYLLNEQFNIKRIAGVFIVIAGLILSQVGTVVRLYQGRRKDHQINKPA
jgi:drug/metabolite transporter (DMT)-like permease